MTCIWPRALLWPTLATIFGLVRSNRPFASIAIGGANPRDFAITANTCGATVAAGAGCKVSVEFVPTVLGLRGASLLITDNAAGSPQSVTLSGTGLAPLVTLSAEGLTFGGQNTGTVSASQTVTLNNTGTAALNISSVVLRGANAGDFVLGCGCNGVTAINASCPLTVIFKPTSTVSLATRFGPPEG